MIKINLLGSDGVSDNRGALVLAGWAASICVLVLILFLVSGSMKSRISELQKDKEQKEQTLARLQKVTDEVKNLEKMKAELNDKLAVIATLKRSKIGPVRVLDDLNASVPERAWLTEISEEGGVVIFSGMALDDQTIATFMRDLDGSAYFSAVDLDHSRQAEYESVKIREFKITARVHYAGELAIKNGQGSQDAPRARFGAS